MTAPPREPLIDAIRHAINCHSAENASNTPDYILAQFLGACLAAFNTATQQRETWYGRDARPSLPAPSADNKPTPGMLRGLSKIAADLAAYRNGTAPSAEPPAQAATDADGLYGKLVPARIQAYLTGGGLFNPELANHAAVRNLIIDSRELIQQQAREIAELTAEARTANERHHVETERRVRAEAERDTLAAIVRAADMMRLADEVTDHYIPDWARYDAARAKWGKP